MPASQDQTQQKEERIDRARHLIEQGFPHARIASRLIARFGCSRRSAYNYINAAESKMAQSDDGPSAEEIAAGADPVELERLLMDDIHLASERGMPGEVYQLIKCLDVVKRWQGKDGPHSRYK